MDDLRDRKAFEAMVIQRAWADPSFKQELLSDPRTVLERELKALDSGASLPDGLLVRVVQESPAELVLVLPTDPRSTELSEEQLDAVAGGGPGAGTPGVNPISGIAGSASTPPA